LKDSIDLETPGGRLIANVMGSVAAYETEIRAERIKSGLDATRPGWQCRGCGEDFLSASRKPQCPACGSYDLKLMKAGKTWGGRLAGSIIPIPRPIGESIMKLYETGMKPSRIAKTVKVSQYRVKGFLQKEGLME
jgi:DNA invertase Pin-like site-specific DNA recombinase